MSTERVLVALSGGVDSSVAALLLQQQGYEVIGVFLRNGIDKPLGAAKNPKQGCCSVEDSRDAALVADRLGIAFHAIDMEQEFQGIMDYFASEYRRGHTPNPCVLCNRDIKFGAMWELADAVDAKFLATGHYARVNQGPQGAQLLRGLDAHKDQSYVLFPIGPKRLNRVLLPIGDLQKSETRQLAEKAQLPVFDKPDSVEICFVPNGDYRELLRDRGGLGKPGQIIDQHGNQLARHDGHAGFTRGQRRGLGFAYKYPMYVLDIDPDSGDVLVGPREATGCSSAVVDGFQTFAYDLPQSDSWVEVLAQFRSTPGGVPARLRRLDEASVEIRFAERADSVNPGQGLAVYQGERLLGGGWIKSTQLDFGFQV
ncbi:MAG: tRNA 2-thiouridine(34) synthase MnmA [Planctomycetota bacterium]|jgi:tRNA-specific 2-thiouridylase|nr:tRNA 2-thiouridine(34) synthase MnmA [Planctomycetota bacterium]